jgi:hypothetical protein
VLTEKGGGGILAKCFLKRIISGKYKSEYEK